MKKFKYEKQMMELINGYLIICPKCGRLHLEYNYNGGGYWQCLWRDCLYRNSDIPSPNYIGYILSLEKDLEFLKQIQYLRKHYKYKPLKKFKAFRKSIKKKVK
jgi:hypothetical protein